MVIWQLVVTGTLLAATLTYLRGWRRMKRFSPATANAPRLVAWFAAMAFFLLAFVFPLPQLAPAHLFARTGQMVAIVFLGVPLCWLSLPFHMVSLGAPSAIRRLDARFLVRPSSLSPLFSTLTQPFTVWFLYLCVVLMWHDPVFAYWSMQSPLRRNLVLLPLLVAALLFWQQITMMGPRRYTKTPPVARFVMLIAVEIPNIIAGITIAFNPEPLYGFYSATEITAIAAGSAFSEQAVSGAMIWVFGSFVYFFSIVLVVNEIFRREGVDHAEPPVNWDSDDRFIAPGLEGRVNESSYRSHNWRDA